MIEHQSQLVMVPGAQLYVETLGPQNGQPLLMLHGGPGADSGYLRPQCDMLAKIPIHGQSSRLIYYDQRGALRSPLEAGQNPGGYQVHVEDIEHLRLALKLPSFMLCGYSWGGLLAILYALKHPKAVKRLILISPAPISSARREEMQRNLLAAGKRQDVQMFREQILAQEATLSADELRHRRFASAVAGYFANPYNALKLTPFRVIQKVEQAIWQSLGNYDFSHQVSVLRSIPSLVIHGNQDVISPDSVKETATLMQANLVILESCGHVPYVEAPDALWGNITEFLIEAR